MGGGGLDVGHVSFIIYRLRQRIFVLVFGICLAYVLVMFLVYVLMYMDVNTTMG